MKQPKTLKRVHKQFLSKQGLKSQDFKYVKEDSESYTFWNQKTGKIEILRR